MSIEITDWLRGLGLEQYAAAFRDNDIDGEILRRLTAEDLRELGVASIGHRRRLLDAIAALDEADTAPAGTAGVPAPASTVVTGAERRQLTVMFCDLVGSTALSRQTDPEDLNALIGAYHRAVAEQVGRFGGYVAKYMGDGVLSYFGYPQAHEDDAALTIQAGLAILDAVPGFAAAAATAATAQQPQVRIGVATGLVVVGELIGGGTAQERNVVGETPNLAARLQSLADPGTLVIAETTHRLVGGLFEYRDLGAVSLRGFAEPVPVWQVLRPSAVESRFEALRAGDLTPLVGREEELDLLLRRWQRATAGEGQVVLLSGEPGIGKSRLTAALRERLEGEPHTRLRYFCSPHHTDSALYPIIGQLQHAAGFAPNELPPAKLDKLDALLSQVTTLAEDRSLLAELLTLDGTDRRYPALDLTPQIRKQRTLNALLRQLEALACRQPVLMLFEDIHCIDPTSFEVLDRTVERIRTLPVLLLVTFRPEFAAPWIGQPHVTSLTLRRLGMRDSAALAGHVSGNHALAAELLDEIVGRADGVPLFLEELTKAVVEVGEDEKMIAAVPSASAAIPATLQASLAARLDRLGPAKEIAQIGATIGREFSYELLRTLTTLTETRLAAALDQLVASELASRRGVPPTASYVFKHALVQETAHETLLRTERRRLHARIADLLEQRADNVERQPELLAQHYAEAGINDKAMDYWTRAGKRSAARSAMVEAEAQFEKALARLALLPDTRERWYKELVLQADLGAVRFAVRGWAAPETGHVYTRARELWEKLGSPSEFLRIPYGQSSYYMYRGELDLALRLDEDLLRLSHRRDDAAGLVIAHLSSGRNLMYAGRFASSRSHLDEVLALYDPIAHGPLVTHAGIHPQVASQFFLGIVLLCLGFPEQALARSRAAIAEARRLTHLPSLVASLSVGARLLCLVGDDAALNERVDELVAVATEQDFPYWHALGTICRGWLQVKNGDVAEGISLLRGGSAAHRDTGAQLFVPHHIALLAKASEIAGQVGEAVILLDNALQIVERTGERWFAAELNRFKGQLLRQRHAEAAEELYRKALSIAVEQEAKLWELRAAASLARLWGEQGRRAEARDLLAPVYGWFTEGFATPDLKEAKALLDELA